MPGFHHTGWFDQYRQGTIDSFVGLQKNNQPRSQGKQKLLIGPWSSSTVGRRLQGDLIFPLNARIDLRQKTLAWLRYWLKGDEAALAGLPTVLYYVMGDVTAPAAPGNEWRVSESWPPTGAETRYYFREGQLLSRESPKRSEISQSYNYDPYRLLLGRGGGHALEEPTDQSFLEKRPDLLLFTTPALTDPMEVTGRVMVKLWARSDAVDTDFLARLTDVYPDGRSILLTEGIIRARFRNGFEREEFPHPDTIYEYLIDLASTSYIFNAGHRIRVTITSNNFPRFEGNPNNGRPHWMLGEPATVARNIIYHDSQRPSHILFNVIGRTD